MSEPTILIARDGAVATLTINRPKVLNALDIPTLLALEAAWSEVEADPAVRVIVITGAGERAFIAGGDIRDLDSRRGLAHYQEFAEVIHRVFRRVETCDKPTIAAVNGSCAAISASSHRRHGWAFLRSRSGSFLAPAVASDLSGRCRSAARRN
jgi:enoyl-CoA hydratase